MLSSLNRVLAAALVLAALTAPARAQHVFEPYVTGGAGRWSNDFTAGALAGAAGGMEWLPAPRVGIGGEAALLGSFGGDLLFTAGADARIHLRQDADVGVLAPYVFAGYSRLTFFEVSGNAVQYGGGVDYRVRPGRAVRLEFRDHVRQSGVTSHYWTIRAGLAFR